MIDFHSFRQSVLNLCKDGYVRSESQRCLHQAVGSAQVEEDQGLQLQALRQHERNHRLARVLT